MFRELLIMTRWRVFDKVLHNVRTFKFSQHSTMKKIGVIAFWSFMLLLVLHMLSRHSNRH